MSSKKEINIFTPLVDASFDVGKHLCKHIYKLLGLNTYDFKKLFEEVGICNKSKEYPTLDNIYNEEYFKRYSFNYPVGISIEDFKKNLEKIAYFLDVDENNIRLERRYNKIDIKIMTNRPNTEYNPLDHQRKDFKIPLGYSLNSSKLILWDLIKSENTHGYLAGSTGGGKSVLLRLILCHLASCKTKRDMNFSIANTKRVDLHYFEKCKHTVNYITGSDDIEDFLDIEIEEMKKRYKLLEKYDCDDLGEYRDKVGRIPYRLIVIEEISSYKGNKVYQKYVEMLASQGRGAGMILLLVTQLPSHDVMPSGIKSNINTTIGLKTKDYIRSEIIAGPDSGLEKLKGKGHSKIFNGDYDAEEFQGFYISKETMKDIIEANSKQNKRAAVAGTTTALCDNKNIGK